MDKNTFFKQKQTLNLRGKLYYFHEPAIMGIVNVTQDSFYQASRLNSVEQIYSKIAQFEQEGACFIDIGASSSRPGAILLNADEEIKCLAPILTSVIPRFPNLYFSLDTVYASVAQMGIEAGISIINDISAGSIDPEIWNVVAKYQMPYVLMHMPGSPQNMQEFTHYEDVVLELRKFFSEKINALKKLGIHDLILDLGFGFGKTSEQNFQLLAQLPLFDDFSCVSLLGISRKSMIYKRLHCSPERALNGTTVLNTIALMKGAQILRVHDVKEAKECSILVQSLKKNDL